MKQIENNDFEQFSQIFQNTLTGDVAPLRLIVFGWLDWSCFSRCYKITLWLDRTVATDPREFTIKHPQEHKRFALLKIRLQRFISLLTSLTFRSGSSTCFGNHSSSLYILPNQNLHEQFDSYYVSLLLSNSGSLRNNVF